MMQAKIFKGQIYIIECNPRIGGASTVSINNGLDAFFWQISKIINKNYKLRFKEKKKTSFLDFQLIFIYKRKYDLNNSPESNFI